MHVHVTFLALPKNQGETRIIIEVGDHHQVNYNNTQVANMPGPRTTMLIEGSFKELVEEFSDYIDNIKASQEASSSLRSDVTPSLDALTKAEEASDSEAAEKARDEVLKVLVPKTDALNSAPEKGNITTRIMVRIWDKRSQTC